MLTVVPTPIGNLADITLRALDALREADVIACEDTRRALKLLNHHGIKKRLIACHRHNEREIAPRLVERAAAGERVVLISDAGTPGISDPGAALIAEAIARGVDMDVLPGPNAPLPALLLSGLPARTFLFMGFIEGSASERRALLAEAARERHTLIFFTAPHDAARDIADLASALGESRRGAVVREISKLHQEVMRATLGELAASASGLRGEIIIVVEGAPEPTPDDETWRAEAERMMASGAFDKEIVNDIVRRYGIAANRIKKFLHSAGGTGS